MNPHRSDEQPPSLEAASPSLTMPSSLTYTASTWQNPQTLIIPGRQFGQSVPVVRRLRIVMQVDTSSCLSSTSPAKGHARYACQYASNDICNEVPSRDKGGRFGIGVECRMSVMARTTPSPPPLSAYACLGTRVHSEFASQAQDSAAHSLSELAVDNTVPFLDVIVIDAFFRRVVSGRHAYAILLGLTDAFNFGEVGTRCRGKPASWIHMTRESGDGDAKRTKTKTKKKVTMTRPPAGGHSNPKLFFASAEHIRPLLARVSARSS